ncbi:NAD(P)-binding protein [Aspergillus affinis]|uniref:NAD(P)-binding protein n=1 Tax=Aspergillus affinis TaxID=1070780 RepID=UPI0022FDBCE6|nr:NAD(P)-binding protein [Aspergillus affinis]KAI9041356.1 NAD(P)-binding protein [Aspergillus affinis]
MPSPKKESHIGLYVTKPIVEAKQSFGRISIYTSAWTLESKRETIDELKQEGVQVIVHDINSPKDVRKAYTAIDTVISALGRGAIAAQIPLIQIANEAPHIKRFLPSEYDKDIEYGPASKDEKPDQQKLKVCATLKTIRESLEYAVGKFVVHTLTHWEAARNRAVKLNSFTTTPAEGGRKLLTIQSAQAEIREIKTEQALKEQNTQLQDEIQALCKQIETQAVSLHPRL